MATEKTELSTCGFSILPEDCVSYLLSFTSPCEVCRLSLVSKFFLAAAQTDLLWESFLPPDVAEILSRAANPVAYSSKKELYFHLCQPLLVDDGKRVGRFMSSAQCITTLNSEFDWASNAAVDLLFNVQSFQLEKSTGRKTYMISPEIMRIVWVETPQYWRWISLPQSRFIKQAELLAVCWLEINCSIDSRLLSQKTMYTAYMIYKLNPDSYGLDSNSQKASIKFGVHSQVNRVTLEPDDEDDEEDDEEEEKQVQLREDGWLKMELGQIYNDQGNEGEIQINFLDVEELHWKKGLVFAGIEIRPTKRKVDAEFLPKARISSLISSLVAALSKVPSVYIPDIVPGICSHQFLNLRLVTFTGSLRQQDIIG
ncbi:hypothetical protein ZIOFF_004579 [Zingiber officinale]|uniref:F-box domain-containing protein n=1 Tax=Zingiber officinale TaxID=94328 RepID=A0A8J5I946_ZINOF|nr:hypothetical protein ZIOFF_004579 [Zingiber officinale]